MSKWFARFWYEHGVRIIFMAITTLFGVGFWYFTDMTGEAKTLLIAVATLCLNKARSDSAEKETTDETE